MSQTNVRTNASSLRPLLLFLHYDSYDSYDFGLSSLLCRSRCFLALGSWWIAALWSTHKHTNAHTHTDTQKCPRQTTTNMSMSSINSIICGPASEWGKVTVDKQSPTCHNEAVDVSVRCARHLDLNSRLETWTRLSSPSESSNWPMTIV